MLTFQASLHRVYYRKAISRCAEEYQAILDLENRLNLLSKDESLEVRQRLVEALNEMKANFVLEISFDFEMVILNSERVNRMLGKVLASTKFKQASWSHILFE